MNPLRVGSRGLCPELVATLAALVLLLQLAGCASRSNRSDTGSGITGADRDRLWLESERQRDDDRSPWERERADQERRLHEDRARVAQQ